MFHTLRTATRLCLAGLAITLSGAALGLLGAEAYADSAGAGTTAVVGNSPYSTTDHTCDPNRDGYHFIINGLVYADGAVIDAADFGPINITFSDGSTAVASFTDLSGDNTAHFLNSTVNQTGGFTITSATMTFPAGTDITGYGNFVISHPPCGTTTSGTTTTTTASTTTTTLVGSEGPVPTTSSPTTMLLGAAPTTSTYSLVASQGPLPTNSAAGAGGLPVTGGSAQIAIIGLFVLGSGLTVLGLARRRSVQN